MMSSFLVRPLRIKKKEEEEREEEERDNAKAGREET